ncbi:hypothetical protein RQM47_16070 [Rubrivirga sp. S365]|nr:hypothetical protein [Rubrivirga sp. S365]MDT7858165.1 hypothetical protein [Rubrivirga sp. S365]
MPLRLPTGPRFPRRGRTVAGGADLVGPADAEALLDGAGVEEPAVVEPAEEVPKWPYAASAVTSLNGTPSAAVGGGATARSTSSRAISIFESFGTPAGT